ncbi:hypothetical protein Taro_024960 [Colocasia esculenta]|uniref:Uncharacterized protein n=1 Tax=Colocasia esculenta TaxID=4460 RepID=A0A843VCT2_COLES|nr:hypothetical protein [Colocasia esculenta]
MEATAFVFPWGHMIPSLEDVSRVIGLRIYGRPVSGYTYPCYHELAERLLDLPVERRSSLVPRVALQESLGLYNAGKNAGESEDEYLERLARVWAYLHFPALGRGDLARPGLMPIARCWDSRRDTRHLMDQLEHLQEAIDSYPYLDVVWQPYLEEGDEGQPWLVQARPYFDRSVWLHALNLVLPLHLHLCQRSLGLRQSAMEFPVQDRFHRLGRSFRGLHDTTDWREQAREQIENWERKGKAVMSDVTTDDAYLQAYALKYGGKVYKSARHQEALEKCLEVYWNGKQRARLGCEGPPMGLEEEAGHPSSGCRQQNRGAGEQKAPHPNRPKWPCLATRQRRELSERRTTIATGEPM